jgi:hypothetical protein
MSILGWWCSFTQMNINRFMCMENFRAGMREPSFFERRKNFKDRFLEYNGETSIAGSQVERFQAAGESKSGRHCPALD